MHTSTSSLSRSIEAGSKSSSTSASLRELEIVKYRCVANFAGADGRGRGEARADRKHVCEIGRIELMRVGRTTLLLKATLIALGEDIVLCI